MNLMTVCLSVGAISFVQSEIGFDPKTPLQTWDYKHTYGGNSDERKRNGCATPDDSRGERLTNLDFTESLRLLNHIYDECKTKVNKRLKNLMKTRVTPELRSFVWSLGQCVKVYSFRALDQILQDDVIPVTKYTYLVRDGLNETERKSARSVTKNTLLPMKEYATLVVPQSWTALLYDRIDNLLRSHSLKFRYHDTFVSRGRSRRRDHRMFAMMVMGFMIMASILIPMGFQFLTVLGGKSLLLAKMALIMSAINGLKKIATSNVGYGFYHTGADGHHHDHPHHGFHEKHLQLHSQNYNPMQGYN